MKKTLLLISTIVLSSCSLTINCNHDCCRKDQLKFQTLPLPLPTFKEHYNRVPYIEDSTDQIFTFPNDRKK